MKSLIKNLIPGLASSWFLIFFATPSWGAAPKLDAFIKSKNQAVSKTAPLPGTHIPDVVYVSPGKAKPRVPPPAPPTASEKISEPPSFVSQRAPAPPPVSPPPTASEKISEPLQTVKKSLTVEQLTDLIQTPVLYAPFRVHSAYIASSGELGVVARFLSGRLAAIPLPFEKNLNILKPVVGIGVNFKAAAPPQFFVTLNSVFKSERFGAAAWLIASRDNLFSKAPADRGVGAIYAFYDFAEPFSHGDLLSVYSGFKSKEIPLTFEAVKGLRNEIDKTAPFVGAFYQWDAAGEWSLSAEAAKGVYSVAINKDF